MTDHIFHPGPPASGRSDHERYQVALMNYPLVVPAVVLLMRRHDLSEAQAFATLESLATTTDLTLDQVAAQVINEQ